MSESNHSTHQQWHQNSPQQRISSPFPSSPPGRTPPIARPDWPWSQPSPLRFSSSHFPHLQRSSSSASASLDSSQGRNAASSSEASSARSASRMSIMSRSSSSRMSWQSSQTMRNNAGSALASYVIPGVEETTTQWSFVGFEWVVRDVHKLRDLLEGINSDPLTATENDTTVTNEGETGTNSLIADDFDILKQSPTIGDKFKLEIDQTASPDASGIGKPATLSLYITCLMLDSGYADYEMSASMMAAVKCQQDRAGERGARPDWLWETWQNDWVFREGNEVWACSLPPLSVLLENNSRIRETDSLVICVQIHCPLGPFFPSHPSAYYVPKDLLDGLEASLDNPNTGDVRFVCLERFNSEAVPPSPTEVSSPVTYRPTSSTSTAHSHSSQMTARKRIIYAHSDILTRRSEYFATMLSSSFSENQAHLSGERKIYTVVVDEADFETVYWLLKYCYANWVLFKEVDDVRAAVEGVGAGWSANWLHARGSEWDWKTFSKMGSTMGDEFDARSATSGETPSQAGDGNSPPPGPSRPVTEVAAIRPTPVAAANPTTTRVSTKGVTSSSRVSTSATSTRRPGATIPISIPSTGSARAKQPPSGPIPHSASNYNPQTPSSSHYPPVSPRASRVRGPSGHGAGMISTPDPHIHPTPQPPAASALSMYQIAHRYTMPALANMALDHMMSTITPQTSFSLLLATSAWDELHTMVEDYVVEKWEDVAVSEEFERCCEEVAAGEWGAEGGKTMMALFRRLKSPTSMLYTRQ
ncbi:hypothetical protein Moror_8138 [Moniliophthora roreri MCA 2997]|uniref:BTB domain-containing protein n=1 Tax=Moniliophthora roreri (strain MCA 2997) TaxID=1381753 RepID=V2XPK2_MONRO|nr:hypothetical protein Moror_8138 [Moniliophthora roreri MCA 2997]